MERNKKIKNTYFLQPTCQGFSEWTHLLDTEKYHFTNIFNKKQESPPLFYAIKYLYTNPL